MGADPAARPPLCWVRETEGSATMPPRKPDEPSILEQMADDAEQTSTPVEYPPGTPEFKVLLAVRPRGRRAEFKRLLAQIAETNPTLRKTQEGLAKIKDDGAREAASMRLWAGLDELLELVEQALRLVAVDSEKFESWVTDVGDEDLQSAWAAYQARAQPGEASSSAS